MCHSTGSIGDTLIDPFFFAAMKYICITLLFFLCSSCTHYTCTQIPVGDTIVKIQHIHNGPGKTFIHLHQNETTALQAAKFVITKDGGSLLTIQHRGGRNITFRLKNKHYEFDPNRIFSDIGIKKTLHEFGQYSLAAHQEVKKLANYLKSQLPAGKIIAVHNNRTYSMHEYFAGHKLAKDIRAMHVYSRNQLRNFYLVTQKQDYLRLTHLPFNSVWQAPNAIDDGSLSIYLSKKDYINVEAGYNQLATQIQMLRNA